ncbi:hypothetical protein [Burkholderia gladioli]|uniref:hypothetical protein n=1 Tax=Burkholderia gladioli TaxID=28095 RepID=UPI00163EC087|nr:hypothetical protein [Burkholderia gladioli]
MSKSSLRKYLAGKRTLRIITSLLFSAAATSLVAWCMFVVSGWGMHRAVSLHPLHGGLDTAAMTNQVIDGAPFAMMFLLIFPVVLAGGPALCIMVYDLLSADTASNAANQPHID